MRTEGYARPDTLPELLELLSELPGARLIAGGTDLMIGVREGRPVGSLVNVSRVPELRRLAVEDGALHVGATVTVAALLRSPELLRHAPLLWHASDRFASPLVRSRATVGGNLCNASPAADLSLALLALDARVELASLAGSRTVSVEELVLGPGKTSLARGEVVTGVRIPLAPGRFHRFEKSGTRPALEISVVAVAVALTLDGGTVSQARLAYGAVAPVPLRGRNAELALTGKPLTPASISAAVAAAVAEVRPIDDVRATALHRRRLVGAFVRRALEAAAPRAATGIQEVSP